MRTAVYCVILGVGVVAGIVVLAGRFWPEDQPDPPGVLEDRILNSASSEEQATAARDMVRHGDAARAEIGRVLVEYEGNDTQVMIPLLQATMKAHAWQSVPRLFELMEHPDPRIRGKAGAAASEIMGADYYFRANHSPEKRAQVLARMRGIYQQMKPELERVYEARQQGPTSAGGGP